MKKKIIFFVESYYRKPQPNGICVKSVVDELVRKDHKVTVFTSKQGYKHPSSEIVNGAQVIRFNRSIAFVLRNASEYYSGMISSTVKFLSKILFKISDVLLSFAWPLHSFLLILKYVISANKNIKSERIDVVVGVYLHIEEVIAAIVIKMIYPKSKLIIYTLDAMTGRTAPKIFGTHKIKKVAIKRWENLVYSKADSICVMEAHRKHYDDSFYDNIRYKIMYMDIPLFNISQKLTRINQIKRKDKIIVYTGFVSETVHSPLYFLELIKNVENVQLHMYGTVGEQVKKIIKESGLENNVVFIKGCRDRPEILRIQREADFLINFGCENYTSIPSKIFEYISSKKPIISFYKINEDASYPYILKYPNSLLLKEDITSLDENLKKFNEFINKTKFNTVNENSLIDLYIDNTPVPMVQEILK